MEPERRTQFLNSKPVWNIEHNVKEIRVYIPRQKRTVSANIGEEVEWRLLDGTVQKVRSLTPVAPFTNKGKL